MLPLWKRILKGQKKSIAAKRAKKVFSPIWHDVIITVNRNYVENIEAAHRQVEALIRQLTKDDDKGTDILEVSPFLTDEHVFARLKAETILKLAETDQKNEPLKRAIYQIWPDFEMQAFLNKSVDTIYGNDDNDERQLYRIGPNVSGLGITWAVLDSGIQSVINSLQAWKNERSAEIRTAINVGHRHFLDNTMHLKPNFHRDFTVRGSQDGKKDDENPFNDVSGHGTHVAGIIAGAAIHITRNGSRYPTPSFFAYKKELRLRESEDITREPEWEVAYTQESIDQITGVAPSCKLVSLKILRNTNNTGSTRSALAAITHILKCNTENPDDKIHGINLSAGYPFDPKWYGCGYSPLCSQLNKLTESGVIVVVAAGNKENLMTIMDPGNAESVITVGSTHREKTEEYGVSFFSSKGPTSDGRLKPDVVAPGEKIISCAAGAMRADAEELLRATWPENTPGRQIDYIEESGTSMAAPHVSGAIAAFLSERREWIGKPQEVKEIFIKTATDLKRNPYWQGAGLINLTKALAYEKPKENDH